MAFSMFPDDNEELIVEAMDSMLDSAIVRRNYASVRWWVTYYYMQGYRNIEILSWENGLVNLSYENDEGELEFTYEKIVDQYRKEVGRLLRVDTRPVAESGGFGLDSVRQGGAAHAVLNYMDGRSTMHARQKQLVEYLELLCMFGTVGLHHYRDETQTDIGRRTCKEVVPPWELLPLPGVIFSRSEERGIQRHRWVPLEWARQQEDLADAFGKASHSALGAVEIPFGESPLTGGPGAETQFRTGFGGASFASARYSKMKERDFSAASKSKARTGKEENKIGVWWIELTEAWEYVPTGDNLVGRYMVKAGDVLGRDERYDEEPIVCPLAVGRYADTNAFYGRGFGDLVLPMNYEVEKMLANAFQNVTDLDVHGTTFIPHNQGISKHELKKRQRRKFIFFMPDQINKDAKAYKLDASNSGDAPLKTIGTAVALADSISGQPANLLAGETPGPRVDSASAMGFAAEMSSISIAQTINGIGDVYVQLYNSMLQTARFEVEDSEEEEYTIGIPALDSRMLGVTLDIKNGKIDLRKNPIPDFRDVRIDIRERSARSTEQMKQEAGLMLEAQVMDVVEFRIVSEREGLGFPFAYKTEYEQWRKAVLIKLIVFNDGVTPGQVPGGVDYENPEIVLEVLQELMGGIEFAMASQEVRDAFIDMRGEYMRNLGNLPDALGPMMQMEGPQEGMEQGGAPPSLMAAQAG